MPTVPLYFRCRRPNRAGGGGSHGSNGGTTVTGNYPDRKEFLRPPDDLDQRSYASNEYRVFDASISYYGVPDYAGEVPGASPFRDYREDTGTTTDFSGAIVYNPTINLSGTNEQVVEGSMTFPDEWNGGSYSHAKAYAINNEWVSWYSGWTAPAGYCEVKRSGREYRFEGKVGGSAFGSLTGSVARTAVSRIDLIIGGVTYNPAFSPAPPNTNYSDLLSQTTDAFSFTHVFTENSGTPIFFQVVDEYGAKSARLELHLAPVPIITIDNEESPIFKLDGSESFSPTSRIVDWQWYQENYSSFHYPSDYFPYYSNLGNSYYVFNYSYPRPSAGVTSSYDFTAALGDADEQQFALWLQVWDAEDLSIYGQSLGENEYVVQLLNVTAAQDRLHAAHTPHGETFTAKKTPNDAPAPGVIVYRTPKGAPAISEVSRVEGVKNPSLYTDSAGILHLAAQNRTSSKWQVLSSYDGGESFN